jgi:hypothetical protein
VEEAGLFLAADNVPRRAKHHAQVHLILKEKEKELSIWFNHVEKLSQIQERDSPTLLTFLFGLS